MTSLNKIFKKKKNSFTKWELLQLTRVYVEVEHLLHMGLSHFHTSYRSPFPQTHTYLLFIHLLPYSRTFYLLIYLFYIINKFTFFMDLHGNMSKVNFTPYVSAIMLSKKYFLKNYFIFLYLITALNKLKNNFFNFNYLACYEIKCFSKSFISENNLSNNKLYFFCQLNKSFFLMLMNT